MGSIDRQKQRQDGEQIDDPDSEAASKPGKTARDSNITAVERLLAETLGLKVSIATKGQEKGKLIIYYNNLDQLDSVCTKLGVES